VILETCHESWYKEIYAHFANKNGLKIIIIKAGFTAAYLVRADSEKPYE
jgi:predicted amidohydrolase